MSSSQKQKKKPAYDVTVRPINSSMISSIEELVGRFIDNTDNKTNPPLDIKETINVPSLETDHQTDRQLPSVSQTSPSLETPPVTEPIKPMSNRHSIPSVLQTPPIPLTEVKGNLSLPNTIVDSLLPQLEPFEQLIYLRLFRLSHGFRKDTCIVGMERLATTCNISLSTTIRNVKSLEQKGLIRRLEAKLGGKMTEIRGNIFWVFNPSVSQTPPISQTPYFTEKAPSLQTPIKDNDHDDYLNKDHHQPSTHNLSDHQKRVMMIYQEVTGNLWSKADHTNYEKIKHIPIEKIEVALKLANDRATNRPNSFAFFIKEILASANPKTQSRTTRKKAMARIVERVRNGCVGSNISPSEFVHKVKEACLREDVAFDNDLLDEVMGK